MTHGKNICNQLKEVRKRIAEENNIPLEIEECTYKGECRGTCPRCEAEVRYLENALADRLRIGKVATVAGLALGLATTTTQAAEACPLTEVSHVVKEAVNVADSVKVSGTTIDQDTKEPLPFVNVIALKDGVAVTGTTTDFDGNYSLHLEYGRYTIKVSFVGYNAYAQEITIKDETKLDVELKSYPSNLAGEVIICGKPSERSSLIEIGPDGATQQMEIEGVKVIVR